MVISWTLVVIGGIYLARQLGVGWFSDLSLDWRVILASVLVAIPSYVLATALMTAIGSMMTTTQEAQSISALVIIPHLLPLFVSWLFINQPHSTLAVILSLCPFTSLVTIGMRNLFTIVPTWQVLTASMIQFLTAIIAVWLAGRAFHLGMLRYSQRLKVGDLIGEKVISKKVSL
jgi:ABC-2 type transport system permease protein